MTRDRNQQQPGQGGRNQNPSSPRPGQQQPGQREEEEEEESGNRREEDEESTPMQREPQSNRGTPGNQGRGGMND